MAYRLSHSIYHLLPHDLEAEKAIFRAVMKDNDAMVHVTENLLPQDFYRPAHQIICSAIYELFMYNKPVKLETLIHILKEKGKLRKIGGEAYLSRIVKNGEVEQDVEYYAKIVRDKACLRRLIEMSNKILKRCKDEDNVDDILDFVEDSVFEILETKIKPKYYYHIGKLIEKSINILEECEMDKSKVKEMPAGVNLLENVMPGIEKPGFYAFYVHPRIGKTNYILPIVKDAAVVKNIPVAIFLLEMSKEQISMCLHHYEAKIESSCIRDRFLNQDERDGFLSQDEWIKLISAAENLCSAPIYIYDSSDIMLREIIQKAHSFKKDIDTGIIIIDHFELINAHSSSEDTNHDFVKAMKSLKVLAKDLDMAIVTFLNKFSTLDILKYHVDTVALISGDKKMLHTN